MNDNNNQASWQWVLDDEYRREAECADQPFPNESPVMDMMFYEFENEGVYHGA